jgi:hypothetical protein
MNVDSVFFIDQKSEAWAKHQVEHILCENLFGSSDLANVNKKEALLLVQETINDLCCSASNAHLFWEKDPPPFVRDSKVQEMIRWVESVFERTNDWTAKILILNFWKALNMVPSYLIFTESQSTSRLSRREPNREDKQESSKT